MSVKTIKEMITASPLEDRHSLAAWLNELLLLVEVKAKRGSRSRR